MLESVLIRLVIAVLLIVYPQLVYIVREALFRSDSKFKRALACDIAYVKKWLPSGASASTRFLSIAPPPFASHHDALDLDVAVATPKPAPKNSCSEEVETTQPHVGVVVNSACENNTPDTSDLEVSFIAKAFNIFEQDLRIPV